MESVNGRFSESASSLSKFFNCPLKKSKTEISDIIIYLGNIERKWEVNK